MKVAMISLALTAALCGQGAFAATKCHLGKMAELPVRMDNSTPLVTVKVDGTEATFIADTGAFFSMLTPESAKKFNLKVGPAPFGLELEGLTGKTDAELARAKDFTLLGLTLHNVDFLVGGHGLNYVDGLLGQNLLGMTDMEYDLGDGAIRFFEAIDCKNVDLAYWSAGKPYGAVDIDPIRTQSDAIRAEVSVNGMKIHAMFDSGSPRSILRLSTAKWVGFSPSDPAVKPGGGTAGIGGRYIQTWIAPFKSFAIDD